MNKTKTGKAMLWTAGVGIYLVGRIVLLNFLKVFAFLGIAASLHLSPALNAKVIIPWVLDETKTIKEETLRASSKILKEFAETKKGKIHVLVINDDTAESLQMLAPQKINAFKVNYLQIEAAEKNTYWVIHTTKKQSLLILPSEAAQTNFSTRMARAEFFIVNPYLQKGEIDRALSEGIVAITTLLLT